MSLEFQKVDLKKVEKETFDDFFELLKEMYMWEFEESGRAMLRALDEEDKVRLHRHLFDEKRIEVILAYVEDNPVGVMVYLETYSTFACKPTLYLEDFFVKAGFRRRGIGAQMFEKLLKIYNEGEYGRFDTLAITWNKRARSFYEKYDIQAAPEYTFYRTQK